MAMGNFCYEQGIECPYATTAGTCRDDILSDFGRCEMLGDDMPPLELPPDVRRAWCASEKVRKWIEADSQGRLVVIPCNVGDLVFVVYSEGHRPHTVDRIHITGNGEVQVRMRAACTPSEGLWLNASEFGKIVFLTESEAEAALKRRKECGK